MDEDETLGGWLKHQREILRNFGLEGDKLSTELRRVFWAERRNSLSGLIKDARGMEEAWKIGADCLEKELNALMMAMCDILDPPNREGE